jgi:hypothetical protein
MRIRTRVLTGVVAALLLVPAGAMAHEQCEEGIVGSAVGTAIHEVEEATTSLPHAVHHVEEIVCDADPT